MIEVLRLGHRIKRDHRISSHVALVARALNVSKIYYTGQKDKEMEKSVLDVVKRFGGDFKIEHLESYKKIIKDKTIVHLTMYGISLNEKLYDIGQSKNILVIVGGEKVSGEIYELADFNISIGNQPHSEVASLGIFLYKFGNEEFSEFLDGEVRILPNEKGKTIKRKT